MVKHRMTQSDLPEVIFITDVQRVPAYEKVIASLPASSAVIIRDYDHGERESYARHITGLCQRRGIKALVAGDIGLARRIGADGVHLPEYQLGQNIPSRHGFTLVTAATKSMISMRRAAIIGVDMALVSPIFKTRSHPAMSGKGVHLLSRMIAHAPLPVVALGGINDKTVKKLNGINLAAVAAIDGLSVVKD